MHYNYDWGSIEIFTGFEAFVNLHDINLDYIKFSTSSDVEGDEEWKLHDESFHNSLESHDNVLMETYVSAQRTEMIN